MTDYYDQAARLRDELIADGKIISPVVEKAFRMVPRELFVPTDTPLKVTYRYDHVRQVTVDGDGTPLNETRMGQPTANKVTSNDGDEGPSEDFTYDFAPDAPFSPA